MINSDRSGADARVGRLSRAPDPGCSCEPWQRLRNKVALPVALFTARDRPRLAVLLLRLIHVVSSWQLAQSHERTSWPGSGTHFASSLKGYLCSAAAAAAANRRLRKAARLVSQRAR